MPRLRLSSPIAIAPALLAAALVAPLLTGCGGAGGGGGEYGQEFEKPADVKESEVTLTPEDFKHDKEP